MGHRTLKRVPLDFQWPLNKVWEGYVNPYPGPLICNLCGGSCYNSATKQIADEFYDHDGDGSRRWCNNITQDEVRALLDEGRLMNFTHVPLNDKQREEVRRKIADGGNSWLPYDNGYIPTANEVNEWNQRGFGHDAINRHILIKARAKRLGVYGLCPVCDGEGELPHPVEAIRVLYEEWEKYEPPPVGKGYQLWETCSEGSPISPVFASPEELASWCFQYETLFGSQRTSYENWLAMFTGKASLEHGGDFTAQPGFIGALENTPK